MNSRSSIARCGALAGLALFFAQSADGDQALRSDIHRQYKHESYMLVEDREGAWLYLFDSGKPPVRVRSIGEPSQFVEHALEKTRSNNARLRVRGLTELAGVDDSRALDTALALLTDTDAAVREEAEQLIVDHPAGAPLVSALGLDDRSEFPEDTDGGQ